MHSSTHNTAHTVAAAATSAVALTPHRRSTAMPRTNNNTLHQQQQQQRSASRPVLQPVLPKAGLVVSEVGRLSEALCKPKLLPLKSANLKRLEALQVCGAVWFGVLLEGSR
jgi:hypothetical protein